MTCLTLADFRAARYTDDELVDRVRDRLITAGAVAAIARLDRLGADERAVLARLERTASASPSLEVEGDSQWRS